VYNHKLRADFCHLQPPNGEEGIVRDKKIVNTVRSQSSDGENLQIEVIARYAKRNPTNYVKKSEKIMENFCLTYCQTENFLV